MSDDEQAAPESELRVGMQAKRVIQSDDEGSDVDGDGGASLRKKQRRSNNVLDSSDSESDVDSGGGKQKKNEIPPEDDAYDRDPASDAPATDTREKALMDAFGSSSDSSDDSDGGFKGFDESEYQDVPEPGVIAQAKGKQRKKKDKEQKKKRTRASEPPEDDAPKTEFEIMMARRKKAMQNKRRRMDSESVEGAPITAQLVKQLKGSMFAAYEADERHNNDQKSKPAHMKTPAFNKLAKLDAVCTQLRKESLREDLIEQNIFDDLAKWLMIGERAALPHPLIRKKLIPIIHSQFIDVDIHYIKSSNIGVMLNLLKQHPRETKENKKLLGQVLEQWARMVFNTRADASSASAEDRQQHAIAVTSDTMRKRRNSQDTAEEDVKLRPGDAGFIMRARVPMAAARDYTRRPVPKQSVLEKIGEDLPKLQAARKSYIKKGAGTFDLMHRKMRDRQMGDAKHKLHARAVNLSGNLTGGRD